MDPSSDAELARVVCAFHSSPGKSLDQRDIRASVNEADWSLYVDGVRLIALRALGDTALADDVAQEAVTRAIATLARGERPIGDVGAFVYGIGRHLIADAYRARARTTSIDGVAEPAEPRVDALEATIAADEQARVHAALVELSPQDREVLRLSFFEGLDAEEIGRLLRDSPVTIRKRKSRALERLRRIFLRHDTPLEPTGT